MKREIHTIFDIILKLIISTHAEEFLKLIGENKSLKRVLRNEFVTKKGRKLYLDFLCELDNETILDIEFQFTGPDSDDLDRFYDYNQISQSEYDTLCETIIISFRTSKSGQKSRKIGKTKSIHPIFFYLGDIDL